MSLSKIPIFKMADYYVYFKDLMNTENNAPWIALQKRALYHAAESKVNSATKNLEEPERIQEAVNFIRRVAANERDKEMMAVKNYCQKLHKKYPAFLTSAHMSEKEIWEQPDKFYIELTKYLNQAKQGARQFKQELRRIRENAGLVEKAWKKKNRSQYSDDNFLYNLQNDLKSLLLKLNGTFVGKNDSPHAYTTKVQEAAIKILNELDIQGKIDNGEDFAAIAAGVVIDLQRHLQEMFDELREQEKIKHNEKLAATMMKEVDDLVDRYLREIENGKDLSSVQEALKDILSIKSNHIIQQIKNGLGIKSITSVEELAKRMDTRAVISNKNKHRTKEYKAMLHNVVGEITNPNLLDTLPRIKFTNFNKKSGHGNIAEVVSAAIQYKKNLGLFINPQVGTDIMEFQINFEIQDPTTESIIKILKRIDQAFSTFEKQTHKEGDSSLRDLAPAVHSLNIALQKTNEELDTLLREAENEEQFFVYHTSQKLQSSIETGKSLGFKGRDSLNILSGIDSIYSSMQAAGIATPSMRDELHFLALNLAPSAVGSEALGPVERYLSRFVGLLMFDDVENMAEEMMGKIEYTNLNTIHVYKLNNVYVPASMLLTYIADEVERATNFALEDIAKLKINTSGAESAIQTWLTTHHEDGERKTYELSDWRNVANQVASGTQISITFMAAFIRFIDNIWNS